MRLIVTGILTLLVSLTFAQDALVDSLSKKYPNADGVFLKFNTFHKIEVNKKTGISITSEIEEERLFLTDKAMAYAEDQIYFSYHLGLNEVQAHSSIPGEKKPKVLKVSKFDTTNGYSSDIFYDDSKNLEFMYKGLQKGARSHKRYTYQEREPRFFGMHYLGSYLPVEYGSIKIECPKDLNLKYQEFNFEKYQVKFEKTELKKTNLYTWTFTEVPRYRYVSSAVGMGYTYPTLILRIADYQWRDSTVQVIPDLDHLYQWYYSNIEEVKGSTDDSLAAFVNTLIDNDTTELQKVETVFNWVQDNIKYVAIEYGSGGIVPRDAGLVYTRRYGDCKDMSCLTHKMLKSVDIESNMAWIGTRKIPFKYSEIPSPLIDNHMICTYEKDGHTYYLDATNPFIPFGVPTAMIQTKETLIEQGPDQYVIKTVPQMPAEYSGSKDSCYLKLKDGKLVGDCIVELKGYSAARFRSFASSKKGKELDIFVRGSVKKGNNKFELGEYSIENLEDKNKDVIINYNFTLEDYATRVDDEIYLNLSLAKNLKGGKFDTTRFVYDYNGRYAFKEQEINVFEVGTGLNVGSIPENSGIEKENYSYSIDYSQQNNTVTMRANVLIDYLIFPTSKFEEYNQVIANINRDYNESILLKSKTQTNDK